MSEADDVLFGRAEMEALRRPLILPQPTLPCKEAPCSVVCCPSSSVFREVPPAVHEHNLFQTNVGMK